jgi:hypothetical protein
VAASEGMPVRPLPSAPGVDSGTRVASSAGAKPSSNFQQSWLGHLIHSIFGSDDQPATARR